MKKYVKNVIIVLIFLNFIVKNQVEAVSVECNTLAVGSFTNNKKSAKEIQEEMSVKNSEALIEKLETELDKNNDKGTEEIKYFKNQFFKDIDFEIYKKEGSFSPEEKQLFLLTILAKMEIDKAGKLSKVYDIDSIKKELRQRRRKIYRESVKGSRADRNNILKKLIELMHVFKDREDSNCKGYVENHKIVDNVKNGKKEFIIKSFLSEKPSNNINIPKDKYTLVKLFRGMTRHLQNDCFAEIKGYSLSKKELAIEYFSDNVMLHLNVHEYLYSSDKFIALMKDLISKLIKLEEKGIIFTDLKFENMLLDKNGKIVFIDGDDMIDKSFDKSKTKVVITPCTVAPEYQNQVRERNDLKITKKSVVFSLGMLFWQARMTGFFMNFWVEHLKEKDFELFKLEDFEEFNSNYKNYKKRYSNIIDGKHYRLVADGELEKTLLEKKFLASEEDKSRNLYRILKRINSDKEKDKDVQEESEVKMMEEICRKTPNQISINKYLEGLMADREEMAIIQYYRYSLFYKKYENFSKDNFIEELVTIQNKNDIIKNAKKWDVPWLCNHLLLKLNAKLVHPKPEQRPALKDVLEELEELEEDARKLRIAYFKESIHPILNAGNKEAFHGIINNIEINKKDKKILLEERVFAGEQQIGKKIEGFLKEILKSITSRQKAKEKFLKLYTAEMFSLAMPNSSEYERSNKANEWNKAYAEKISALGIMEIIDVWVDPTGKSSA